MAPSKRKDPNAFPTRQLAVLGTLILILSSNFPLRLILEKLR